jgi:hypothetical protein
MAHPSAVTDDTATTYHPHGNVVRDNIMFDVSGLRFKGTDWAHVTGINNVWVDRGESDGVTAEEMPGSAVTMTGNRFYTDQTSTFGDMRDRTR